MRSHRRAWLFLLAVAAVLSSGCTGYEFTGNPLIGQWRAETPTPLGRFNLGRWSFTSDRVSAYGYDHPVDYSVSGNVVSVIPRDFGPELEFEMVDPDTARLTTPQFDGLLTLRRVTPPASVSDAADD